jgi:hypothetical protein
MSRRVGVYLGAALWAVLWAPQARADGQRDLDDGVAFYENLDLERARERLEAAASSPDLAAQGRARAYLYLGMLEFELGDAAAADTAWLHAFGLDKTMAAPDGTSPKTIAAMNAVRARARPEAPPPAVAPPPPPPAPPPPAAPPPALVTSPPPPEEDEGGSGPWLWIGIGAGVAVAAGVVAGVLLAGGGGDNGACGRNGGGCLDVVVR